MTEDRYPLRPVGRLQDDKTPPRTLDEALAARGMTRDDLAETCRVVSPDWATSAKALSRRQAEGLAAGRAFAEALEPLVDKDRGCFFPDGIYFDGMSNPPEHLGTWFEGRFVAGDKPVELTLSPADCDRLRQAIVDGELGFVRSLEAPRRWRWYTDAAVLGLIGAALVVVVLAYWITGP